VCPNACANLTNDKQNCGGCGIACEGYQYCRASKCTPTYAWTRVLPVTPLDAIPQVQSAAVGSTGDIFVQSTLFPGATPATVTFSNASETNNQATTMFTTSVLARYTAANVLQLGANLTFSFLGQSSGISSLSNIALTSTDDVMVGGVDIVTSASGVNTGTNVLTRLDSTLFLNRKWAASLPAGGGAVQIFPRTPRGDYVTTGFVPDEFHGITGQVDQVVENATLGTSLGSYIDQSAALGSDKTTLWLGGGNAGQVGVSGLLALNPWSPTTTNVAAGQSFIIGAKDNGTSFGPWLTTNASTRPAAFWKLAATATGDLIVLTGGGGRGDTGAVSLNGREILSLADTQAIFKLATSTGTVLWKTGITSSFPFITIAPDGATIAVGSQGATYSLNMLSDADGSIVASFTGSGTAQAIAAGVNSLYVLGVVTGAADFNPGAKTDIQGNLPGIFITRFSY
jgi:hypothetical protein